MGGDRIFASLSDIEILLPFKYLNLFTFTEIKTN